MIKTMQTGCSQTRLTLKKPKEPGKLFILSTSSKVKPKKRRLTTELYPEIILIRSQLSKPKNKKLSKHKLASTGRKSPRLNFASKPMKRRHEKWERSVIKPSHNFLRIQVFLVKSLHQVRFTCKTTLKKRQTSCPTLITSQWSTKSVTSWLHQSSLKMEIPRTA